MKFNNLDLEKQFTKPELLFPNKKYLEDLSNFSYSISIEEQSCQFLVLFNVIGKAKSFHTVLRYKTLLELHTELRELLPNSVYFLICKKTKSCLVTEEYLNTYGKILLRDYLSPTNYGFNQNIEDISFIYYEDCRFLICMKDNKFINLTCRIGDEKLYEL